MYSIVLALCCLISGFIHSQSGTPLANVHIVLVGPSHSVANSDAKGDFSITAAPGPYTLNASVRGYSSVTTALALEHDVAVLLLPDLRSSRAR